LHVKHGKTVTPSTYANDGDNLVRANAQEKYMGNVSVEFEGELAEQLKESAKVMGITVRELVVHAVLQYIESFPDSEDESEEEDEDIEAEDQNE
jgi:hypothetical protein